MGVSTDGQICFGVQLEEDYEFPWDSLEDSDEEEWWRTENGYKPSFELFDDLGEWLPGMAADVAAHHRYYQERRDFEATIPPFPLELVNVCSDKCPMWIIAVPGTVKTCRRGYPEGFHLQQLTVNPEAFAAFLAFCEKYEIELPKNPQWWLSSYWG